MKQSEAIGKHVLPTDNWNPAVAAPSRVIDYIDLSAIDSESKRISEVKQILGKEAPSRARQLVRAADVLVSTVRPNLNGLAIVPEELDGATASTGFTVLRANETSLSARYLYHWLKTPEFISDMVKKATGQSYPAVSNAIVLESIMPLPKIEEQRRIAAILDQVEALRAKRRQALAKLDTLTQSLFLEMFGDPRPQARTKTLADVCHTIVDGTHKTPTYVEAGIPFVTVKNIAKGQLDLTDTKFISSEEHKALTKRTQPQQGDILVSKDGTIGIPCLVDTDEVFSIFVSVALLKLKAELVNPTFLCAQLASEAVQKQIRDSSKGIAIRHLHLTDFKRLKLTIPPMQEQIRFCSFVQKIREFKKNTDCAEIALANLSASLQHRAFRGEL